MSSVLGLPSGRGQKFGVAPRGWEDYQRQKGPEDLCPSPELYYSMLFWLLGGARERICYTGDTKGDHRNLKKEYGVKRSKCPAISHHLLGGVGEGASSSDSDFETP